MKYILCAICGLFVIGCENQRAADTNASLGSQEARKPGETTDRTNTAVNARDRNSDTKTPINQDENEADVKTTANIRKQIVDRKMSVDATNIKIITHEHKVTLRGVVDTADEKDAIEEIAKSVAGAENVDSQLEVKNK